MREPKQGEVWADTNFWNGPRMVRVDSVAADGHVAWSQVVDVGQVADSGTCTRDRFLARFKWSGHPEAAREPTARELAAACALAEGRLVVQDELRRKLKAVTEERDDLALRAMASERDARTAAVALRDAPPTAPRSGWPGVAEVARTPAARDALAELRALHDLDLGALAQDSGVRLGAMPVDVGRFLTDPATAEIRTTEEGRQNLVEQQTGRGYFSWSSEVRSLAALGAQVRAALGVAAEPP